VREDSVPTPIQAPELERMVAVLRKRAEQEKVSLPRDVALYLAKNFRSSTRTLEGALLRLIAYASMTGTPITLTHTRQVLKQFIDAQTHKAPVDSFPKMPPEQSGTVVANIRRQYRVASDRGVAFWLQTRDGKHNCQVRNKLEVNMRERERGQLAHWDAYERALERRAKMRKQG
jgi:chromosomal replication initiation ATPase DnaA